MRRDVSWILLLICLLAQALLTRNQLRTNPHAGVKFYRRAPALNTLLSLNDFYRTHQEWLQQAAVLNELVEFWPTNIRGGTAGRARYTAELARAQERRGDLPAAEESFKAALSLYNQAGPSYVAASDATKRSLARLLKDSGRDNEAEQIESSVRPRGHFSKPTDRAHILSKVEPSYTSDARDHWISGNITLSVIVDETGHPKDIQVIRPLGFGLDQSATAAVERWTFQPADVNGTPVPSRVTVEVSFRFL